MKELILIEKDPKLPWAVFVGAAGMPGVHARPYPLLWMNEFPMKYLRQDRVYGLEGILACEEGGGYCHYYCHASAIRVAFL
jgi:hypothetical protein